MSPEEELALVLRAQNGEREALGKIWDAATPKLFGYLINVVHELSLAEDLLQQTWLKAISALGGFQPRGVRFSAWLFAIARNECRHHWRSTNRHGTPEIREESSSDPQTLEEKLFVDTVLKALSEEDRELLRLRYLADLSFKDIAQVLAISGVAARVRMHRALSRARLIVKNN